MPPQSKTDNTVEGRTVEITMEDGETFSVSPLPSAPPARPWPLCRPPRRLTPRRPRHDAPLHLQIIKNKKYRHYGISDEKEPRPFSFKSNK